MSVSHAGAGAATTPQPAPSNATVTGSRYLAQTLHVYAPVNFAGIAESFGCMGIRVERTNELRPALERAAAVIRPVVIDAASDPAAQADLPWTPKA